MNQSETYSATGSSRSPEFIYRCCKPDYSTNPRPQNPKISWFTKFKEWFFPSDHAYCLPSYPTTPGKYHFS